ncbi:hypothetical protein PoB_004818700 [Plakobranchus ocellatus]|uniref:Uncharacterized protein n=1 Tax=Plakobranchus ocellatus TaxID=259542 RepID=A0AAV4BQN9_9GAST|nr:hypothetical protein PoB_004818700 [Plakobranchus ocellatus]
MTDLYSQLKAGSASDDFLQDQKTSIQWLNGSETWIRAIHFLGEAHETKRATMLAIQDQGSSKRRQKLNTYVCHKVDVEKQGLVPVVFEECRLKSCQERPGLLGELDKQQQLQTMWPLNSEVRKQEQIGHPGSRIGLHWDIILVLEISNPIVEKSTNAQLVDKMPSVKLIQHNIYRPAYLVHQFWGIKM